MIGWYKTGFMVHVTRENGAGKCKAGGMTNLANDDHDGGNIDCTFVEQHYCRDYCRGCAEFHMSFVCMAELMLLIHC